MCITRGRKTKMQSMTAYDPKKLKPAQKELFYRIFWQKETQCSIAAEEGVSKMAISKRLKTT